jgi:galactokinase
MASDSALGRRAWAPGRVNLIGDHTDYNGGLALPMAIDLGVEASYRPNAHGALVIDTDIDPVPAEIPIAVDIPRTLPSWGRLAAAVVEQIPLGRGGHVVVHSDLPLGAGLSSSAAFCVALALALGAEAVPIEVAELCQRAERKVGVPVGLMDPLVSMSATIGNALLIDFTTLAIEPVPVPSDVEILIIDSGTTRRLEESRYAERRSQCAAASAALGGSLGRARAGDIDRISAPLLRRRARHVISEVARVTEFAHALVQRDVARAGALMVESHRSLRDDFEVSAPELDVLVELACATAGVHGARLTGAGFGGCVVALCRPGVRLAIPNRQWRVRPGAGASVKSLVP